MVAPRHVDACSRLQVWRLERRDARGTHDVFNTPDFEKPEWYARRGALRYVNLPRVEYTLGPGRRVFLNAKPAMILRRRHPLELQHGMQRPPARLRDAH